ncbi:MAG TPA: MFS transporter, partial [Rectinemataceae bacterium]|nr:MFS transporter [Rectinemataceae bacterium]
ASLALLCMTPRRRVEAPRRFVVRASYRRYYLLSTLYGARKQIFITFGPWMLVDLFHRDVAVMTFLFLVVSVIGIWAQPFVGRLTDRFGVRAVLGGEALSTIVVCILYAFAPGLLPLRAALVVVAACYVVDQSSNCVAMTRAIYAKQMVKCPEDLSPTLSLGISIDHAVSMFLPMLGGLAWHGGGSAGYRWVFLGGSIVAAVNFLATRGLPARNRMALAVD